MYCTIRAVACVMIHDNENTNQFGLDWAYYCEVNPRQAKQLWCVLLKDNHHQSSRYYEISLWHQLDLEIGRMCAQSHTPRVVSEIISSDGRVLPERAWKMLFVIYLILCLSSVRWYHRWNMTGTPLWIHWGFNLLCVVCIAYLEASESTGLATMDICKGTASLRNSRPQ